MIKIQLNTTVCIIIKEEKSMDNTEKKKRRSFLNKIRTLFRKPKEEKNEIGKHFKYVKNGPCDKDDYDGYAKLLDEKIKEKDVFNIGIISPYSGGKSSLILRYKEHYAKSFAKKIKTVSLANFDSNEKDDNLEELSLDSQNDQPSDDLGTSAQNGAAKNRVSKKALISSDIEKSILEQLLYEANFRSLPDSNISRIHSKLPYLIISIILLLLIIAIGIVGLGIWKNVLFVNYFSGNTEKESLKNNVLLFGLGLLLILISALVITLVRASKIKHIKYKNIELDFINEKDSSSYLNVFIDELIYYFKQTKTRVVIFEDIDRFEDVYIFAKLREINTIINENKTLRRRKITFVYAIKDGLFKNPDDRSKFFDYIISLLPIMSSEKARDFMYRGIDNSINGKDLGLDPVMISDISKYLIDLRMVKNTLNDCLLYKEVLKISKTHDLEQLFAFMVYKNVMPSDYNDLLQKRGVLYSLLNEEKNTQIQNYVDEANQKITTLASKIDGLREDKTIAKDFEDLKRLIMGIALQKGTVIINQASSGYVDVVPLESFKDVNKGIYFKKSISDGYYGTRNYYFNLDINTINQHFDKDVYEIEKIITNKNEEEIKKLREEISDIEINIKKAKTMSIKELINKGIYRPINDPKKPGKQMLISMISKGYIDSNYKTMLVRNNNSILTESDNEIITKIQKNEEVENQNVHIENPKLIVNDLSDDAFLKQSILYNDLIDYIFANSAFSQKRSNFISLIAERSDNTKQFLADYFLGGSKVKEIVEACKNKYPEIIFDVLTVLSNDESKQCIIVNLLLEFGNSISVADLNFENVITNYFNNSSAIIGNHIKHCHSLDFFIETLIELKVVVSEIDFYQEYDEKETQAFRLIVENNLYEMNRNNVFKITRYYLNSPQPNITAYYLSNNAKVNENFKNKINEHVGIIAENAASLDEDIKAITFVLKSKEVDIKNKFYFIAKISQRVAFDDEMDDNVLFELAKTNKMEPSWDAVQSLVSKGCEMSIIRTMIENNHEYFENNQCIYKDLAIKIINETQFSNDEVFENISKSFKVDLNPSSITDDSKLAILIKNCIVDHTTQELSECKDRPLAMESLLIANESLAEDLKKVSVPIQTIMFLLKSKCISNNQKETIVSQYSSVLEIESVETAQIIFNAIKNGDKSIDANLLISIYDKVENVDVKKEVEQVGCDRISGNNLIKFIKHVEPVLIDELTAENIVRIDKEFCESNHFMKSLIKNKFITVIKHSPKKYPIDTSVLIEKTNE